MRSSGSRRLVVTVVAAGVALGCAGCGGSLPGTTGAATSAPASSPGSLATGGPGKAALGALLPPVTACLNTHGVMLPAHATAKQVKNALRLLPLTMQQSAFTACESSLPVGVRQDIQQALDNEKEPG